MVFGTSNDDNDVFVSFTKKSINHDDTGTAEDPQTFLLMPLLKVKVKVEVEDMDGSIYIYPCVWTAL